MKLTVLDSLYFVSCNFYKKREKNIFKASGIILLTCAILCYLQLIIFLMSDFTEWFNEDEINGHRYSMVFGGIIIIEVLLYIRFFRVTNYDEIYDKFNELSYSSKTIHYLFANAFIWLSFISMFGYAIWQGSINN